VLPAAELEGELEEEELEEEEDAAGAAQWEETETTSTSCRTPPPGLMLPPGLEGFYKKTDSPVMPLLPEFPVDLPQAPSFALSSIQVHVLGLPNRLLSDAMLEAMTEQAGVDSMVLGFRTFPGQSTGEAFVTFDNSFAASRFAAHVQGVRWGPGTKVVVRVVAPKTPAPSKLRQQPAGTPAKKAGELRAHLKKDAPAYIHVSSQLSAAAPAFVPLVAYVERSAETPVRVAAAAGAAEFACLSQAGSDVSTEIGESEAELDKDIPLTMLSTLLSF